MKIVVDRQIPFIEGVFEPYGAEVVYIEGKDICRFDVIDADALIVRTRTKCNAELLDGSSVKIIASASIGTNHIDFDFCRGHGIFVQNAAGASSGAVMNYVFSAIYGVAARKSVSLDGAKIGILGMGSSGLRVGYMALNLGLEVFGYDPPRMAAEGPGRFCDLETLLRESDIVTLHLPLNASTKNFANAEFFARMKPGAFFINTARGELVDETALCDAANKLGAIIIDAWNNEPNINPKLVDIADVATPHVAGYSMQAKLASSTMVVKAVARFFGITQLYDYYPVSTSEEYQAVKLDLNGKSQGEIASIFQYNYPIFTDDFMLRISPDSFNELRLNYRYRREFYVNL